MQASVLLAILCCRSCFTGSGGSRLGTKINGITRGRSTRSQQRLCQPRSTTLENVPFGDGRIDLRFDAIQAKEDDGKSEQEKAADCQDDVAATATRAVLPGANSSGQTKQKHGGKGPSEGPGYLERSGGHFGARIEKGVNLASTPSPVDYCGKVEFLDSKDPCPQF